MSFIIAEDCGQVLKGMIYTGFGQGGLAFLLALGYIHLYLPVSIFTLTFMAFVMVFTAGVTLPGSIVILVILAGHAMWNGHVLAAVLLLGWCVPVGANDNVTRSKVVGSAVNINPWIMIFVMIGGFLADGPIGVVSGPFMLILAKHIYVLLKAVIRTAE